MCKDVIFNIKFIFTAVMCQVLQVYCSAYTVIINMSELGTSKKTLMYLYSLNWKTGLLGEKISRCSLGTGRVLNTVLNKGYL